MYLLYLFYVIDSAHMNVKCILLYKSYNLRFGLTYYKYECVCDYFPHFIFMTERKNIKKSQIRRFPRHYSFKSAHLKPPSMIAPAKIK